jgi:hypothetical protein
MIYLISKINVKAHAHNENIAKRATVLHKQGVFIPHKHNPFDVPHKEMQLEVFQEDLNAMQQSSIGIVSLPIGKDCSSELGWYAGNSKYVSALIIGDEWYTAKEQFESLENDWMLKGFLSDVTTDDIEVFKMLKNDPILQYKSVFIE